MSIRILLADDHEMIRQGVRRLIEKRSDWEVCGEASTGREAVALAEQLRPDVLIMDMTMPELNGLEATRQIKKSAPTVEVLLFTGDRSDAAVHAAFAAGVRSYIAKTEIAAHLLAAIESLSAHKPYFTSEVSTILFDRLVNGGARGDRENPADELTGREREIVQLLVEGQSNKEVAAALGISIKTVETHRAAIMRKLRMKSFSDLVRYAIRNKMIEA